MSNHTVPAAAEGMPAFLTLHADAGGLRRLSTSELCYLSDALRTLSDVAIALSCQPRFQSAQPHIYNAAGEALDTVNELFSASLTRLRDELERRAPNTRAEAKTRAEHIVMDEATICDDFDRLAAVCSSLTFAPTAFAEAVR